MVLDNGSKRRVDRIGQGNDLALDPLKVTFVTFDKLVTFSNVGGAIEFAAVPLCGLPRGDFLVAGGVLQLDAFEDPSDPELVQTFNLTTALGTTATVDLTLATTEINLLTAAAAGVASGGVGPHVKRALDGINTLAGAAGAAAGTFNNNAGALAVFLNMTLPDADVTGPVTFRIKGSIRIVTIGFGKNALA
jgi:hypothetical protein